VWAARATEELVQRARRGDARALEEIVRAYQGICISEPLAARPERKSAA
jgi:hypothetical protein